MASAFDPYSEWLHIPKEGFHPDRYRLLGLNLFEGDPGAIERAASERISRIENMRSGQHAAAATKLINELQNAKACLLDSTKKQTYDAMLRQQLATRVPVNTPAAAPASDPSSFLGGGESDIDSMLPPIAVNMPTAPTPAHGAIPMAVPIAPGGYGQIPQAMPVMAHAVPAYATPAYPTAVAAYPAQPYGTPVMAQAMPMPSAAPVAFAEDIGASYAQSPARRRPRSRGVGGILMAGAIPLVVIGGLIVAVWMLNKNGYLKNDTAKQPDDASQQVAMASSTGQPAENTGPIRPRKKKPEFRDLSNFKDPEEKTEGDPADDEPSEETEMGEEPAMAEEPEADPFMKRDPSFAEPEPEATPESLPKVDVAQALDGARYALSQRDTAKAGKLLDAAAASATEDSERKEVERVGVMQVYVEGFWKAVDESLKSFEVGSQFEYEGVPAGFVAKDGKTITLRIEAKNLEFNVDNLPPKLAVALAENYFKDDDPAALLSVGAYLVVTPKGDRKKAEELWLKASLGGLATEADLVMPELKVKIPDEMVAVALPENTEAATGSPDGKKPAPDAEAQTKAKEQVHNRFEAEFAAKTPAEMSALADKLLTEGVSETSAALAYALFDEARLLGIQAADSGVVIRAIDALAGAFSIENGLKMKADALDEASKSAAAGPEASAALAQAGLDLVDEAVVVEDIPVAKLLGRMALAAARKSKDPELLKAASARNKEVQSLKAN